MALVVTSLLDYFVFLKGGKESVFKATLLIPCGYVVYNALSTMWLVQIKIKDYQRSVEMPCLGGYVQFVQDLAKEGLVVNYRHFLCILGMMVARVLFFLLLVDVDNCARVLRLLGYPQNV